MPGQLGKNWTGAVAERGPGGAGGASAGLGWVRKKVQAGAGIWLIKDISEHLVMLGCGGMSVVARLSRQCWRWYKRAELADTI